VVPLSVFALLASARPRSSTFIREMVNRSCKYKQSILKIHFTS
jgi:hypothetical protein